VYDDIHLNNSIVDKLPKVVLTERGSSVSSVGHKLSPPDQQKLDHFSILPINFNRWRG